MADRYWVGGTGTWNSTNTTNWSTQSGGSGGASVPTASDSVFFDSGSGTNFTVTIASSFFATCLDFNVVTGVVGMTLTSTNGFVIISGSLSFPTTGLTISSGWSSGGGFVFNSSASGNTVNTNGVTLFPTVGPTFRFDGTGSWTLQSAVTTGSYFELRNGTFNTGNHNVTALSYTFNGSGTAGTFNAGTSTITWTQNQTEGWAALVNGSPVFNTGNATLIGTGTNSYFNGAGATYGEVRFTNTAIGTISPIGTATIGNLVFAARAATGISTISFSSTTNYTITGTLTVQPGNTDSTRRFAFVSDTLGAQRTIRVAATSGMYATDFRDINFAGAASPLDGTSLNFGNAQGNNGIIFPAAKTVYYGTTVNSGWGANCWSLSIGGGTSLANFPLAQDTAVIPSGYPNFNTTLNFGASWHVGSIDLSARTSSFPMTIGAASIIVPIYGNWITGTGASVGASIGGGLQFLGRSLQTITSNGRTFAPSITLNNVSGTTRLQDALTTSSTFTLTQGTLDLNGTTLTTTGGFSSSNSNARTIVFGGGTISSGAGWTTTTATNLRINGVGTINMTSASAKTFAGGGATYTGITLNQGGTGALTISGSNKFSTMTNTAIGSVLFTSGTTNEFIVFNLNGTAGNLLTLGATSTSQAIIRKIGPWYVGANSTNGGNNTNLIFTAGDLMDYLSISYINGNALAPVYVNMGSMTVAGGIIITA